MAKNQSNTTQIKKVIQAFLKQNNLSKGLNDLALQRHWKEIMGANVQSYTDRLQLKDEVLYVKLSSSVLREELSHNKQNILLKIQEIFPENIAKIVFI